MKKLEEMTRYELAEVIVDDQIKRGVVKPENKESQIQGRLNGVGALKPMTKSELYKSAKYILDENKKHWYEINIYDFKGDKIDGFMTPSDSIHDLIELIERRKGYLEENYPYEFIGTVKITIESII